MNRPPFPRGLHGVSRTAWTAAEATARAATLADITGMRCVAYRIPDPDPASPPWRWHQLGQDGQPIPVLFWPSPSRRLWAGETLEDELSRGDL